MLIESPPTFSPRAIRTGNPDWDRMSQSLLDAVSAVVPHAVGQGAEKVLDDAFEAWPVRTGKSRDALELTYETTDTAFSAVLDNGAPYANEIHDGETVAELIVEPAEAALPGILAELDRLIGKAA